MPVVTVGIDPARNVFAIHGVEESGKAVLVKPRVMRDQLTTLIGQLPPCLIGMKACSGAHPYRMSGKHGKNDAAAICEAVTHPSVGLCR